MSEKKKVSIVVLGDIGRSPRMQFHALSLANEGYTVNIIGYKNSEIPDVIAKHSDIKIRPLAPCRSFFPQFLSYIYKAIWQSITLFYALWIACGDYVLVQNPPAVPSLFICWLYCFILRRKFIIDWHNYAYTVMALNVGLNHILTKLTKLIEFYFGRLSHANICVTNAMKKDLQTKWNIKAITLHDKPAEIFRPISLLEKYVFLNNLVSKYPDLADTIPEINAEQDLILSHERSGLIISSTSWTEDEDFSLLFNALKLYEKSCQDDNINKLPKLVCVITGKGPLKDYYLEEIENEKMEYVKIITPWLSYIDYAFMLACADVGVCLHTSTSGLDLPMKIVDMFGCELPVCAYNFKCLSELVKHDENGYVFENEFELAEQLIDWFKYFSSNVERKETITKFKTNMREFRAVRWRENWETEVKHLFE